jgi:hypothetical protein
MAAISILALSPIIPTPYQNADANLGGSGTLAFAFKQSWSAGALACGFSIGDYPNFTNSGNLFSVSFVAQVWGSDQGDLAAPPHMN